MASGTTSAAIAGVPDLVGKRYAVIFLGHAADAGMGSGYAGGAIEAGSSNTEIILKDFHLGFDLPVNVSGNKLEILNAVTSTTTTMPEYNTMQFYGVVRHSNNDYGYGGFDDMGRYVYTNNYGYMRHSSGIISEKYTFDTDTSCDYFRFNSPFCTVIEDNSGNRHPWLFGGMLVYVYEPNAMARAYLGDELMTTYPVRLSFGTEGFDSLFGVRIVNWFDRGVGYDNISADNAVQMSNAMADIDIADHTSYLKRMPVGGYYETGSDWQTPGDERYYKVWRTSLSKRYDDYAVDYKTPHTGANGEFSLEGTVHHRLADEYWVTDGGKQTTHEPPLVFTFHNPGILRQSDTD